MTWQDQALDHARDKYVVDLKKREQTPETVLDLLKGSIADLQETVENELEQKRALKVCCFETFMVLIVENCRSP